MAKILAEKSHGSKFAPQILAIWISTLHCSGDCDFMVTIVTMDLNGAPFRPNCVKSLILNVQRSHGLLTGSQGISGKSEHLHLQGIWAPWS